MRGSSVAIIGAGLAGLTCATHLMAAGFEVTLFDKGARAGGRMSTRRLPTPLGDASFDHGAQYFTVRNPAFRAQVESWAGLGLAAPWPDAGPDAWVGTPAMNAPVKHMAALLDVRWSARVTGLDRAGEAWRLDCDGAAAAVAGTVVLAIPAEQAADLLRPVSPGLADIASAARSAPCWTVMAAFAERLPVAASTLRDAGAVGWAARNNAKPGRAGLECWVVQASPAWSRDHLEDDSATVAPALLEALAAALALRLPEPVGLSAHRWRFARSGCAGQSMLWDAGRQLGRCGDWLLGPRVEAAWLSGARLAAAVIGHTPAVA